MGVDRKFLLKKIESDAQSITPISDEPDEQTEIGISLLEEEEKRTRIREMKQNIEERKKYAKIVFCYIYLWSFVLFVLLFLLGFKILLLSDKIIITLLSATTIKVVGLAYFIINNLFPKQK